MSSGGRLLTTREVAERLGISAATVLRRHGIGELPGYRLATNVLRFDREEIDSWLEGKRSGTLAALPDDRSERAS